MWRRKFSTVKTLRSGEDIKPLYRKELCDPVIVTPIILLHVNVEVNLDSVGAYLYVV